jgi:predicted ATP-binding protein involved in virulence
MQIKELYIKNFRGIEAKTIRLNPRFTVAIGDNGMGKSSILHALQVALGAYLQSLPLPGSPVYRRQFKIGDRFVKWNELERDYIPNDDNTSISVKAKLNDNLPEIEWTRTMLKNGGTSHNSKETGQLIAAVNDLIKTRKSEQVTLPVLANFGTERTTAQLRKGKLAQQRRTKMEKAYLASLTSNVDFNGVLEWLHNYDSELKEGKEFKGTREAVFNAIAEAIPYLKDVAYNNYYTELDAVVKIDDNFLGRKTHSNMSDGLIAMLNMVAELAFRCVILNGFLGYEAVKQSKGIVLIDELDMHLHPNWQRHVVADLKNAFPNIQFVVTTHSAFIVQSLNSDELYNLDKPTDVDLKDLKIDDVATEVMGVESPFAEENTEKYKQAKDILQKIKAGVSSDSVQENINNITDPGLRAFLELNNLAKGE